MINTKVDGQSMGNHAVVDVQPVWKDGKYVITILDLPEGSTVKIALPGRGDDPAVLRLGEAIWSERGRWDGLETFRDARVVGPVQEV